MKRILAILLSVLMVISCFNVNVFAAEENSNETGEVALMYTQEFSDALNSFLIDEANKGIYYFEYEYVHTQDGYYEYSYKDLVTPQNIDTKEWLTVYHQFSGIVFGIQGVMEAISEETIGDYTFKANYTFDTDSNPCGYFYYEDGKICGISDAVEQGLVTVEYLAEHIPDTVFMTDELKAEAILKTYHNKDYDLVKIGDIEGAYGLFYCLNSNVYRKEEYTMYFGDYKFSAPETLSPDPFGLIVVKNRFYDDFQEAYEYGLIKDMDAVYEMITSADIDYTFTVEKYEPEITNPDEKLFIQYLKDNNLYWYGPENTEDYYFNKLGEIEGYNLYAGHSLVWYENHSLYVDDKVVNFSRKYSDFYLIKDMRVITLSYALENGEITDTELLMDILETYHNSDPNSIIYSIEYSELSKSPEFCDELNNYIIDLGLGEKYFEVDTTADGYVEGDPATYTYTNLFTPENIATSGKIKIFKETPYKIYLQIIGDEAEGTEKTIGSYRFYSDTFFHEDNPCGYLVGTKYGVYDIPEPNQWEDQSVVDEYAEVFPCENLKSEEIQAVEASIKEKYNNRNLNLHNLGSTENYELYYDFPYMVQNLYYDKYFGKYIFTLFTQNPSYDLGLYVWYNNEAYTFDNAYDNGIIADMDAVIEIIGDGLITFNVTKMDESMYMLIQHLESQGISMSDSIGDSITYKNLGTVGEFTLCYGGKQRRSVEDTYRIGNVLISGIFTYPENPSGFWLISNEKVYTLAEAYSNRIVTPEQFNEIADLIISKNNTWWTAEKIVYVTTLKDKIQSGEKVKLLTVENADNKEITFTSKTPEIAKINKKGVVTGLQKGMAEFEITVGEEKFTAKVKVKNNPKLAQKKVKVNRKDTVKVAIKGKVKGIKNVYTNTKIAKIKSKPNASTLKIKGLKKGKTTLKIKVNGVKTLKLKVVVK